MPIDFNDNLQIRAPKPIDDRYGPWETIEEGLINVPYSYRHAKLTLNIAGVEYWFKDGLTDINLVIKEYGSSSDTSKLTLSLFKQGSNGVIFPQIFKWDTNLTISNVFLMSNCASISIKIAGVTYTSNFIGLIILANTELEILDINIQAGHENANAIIIF